MAKDIGAFIKSYVKGQALLCLILSIIYAIGFGLTGLPWGYFVGFLTGFFSWIPLFGSMLGFFVAMIIVLFNFNWQLLVLVCSVYVAAQLLEGLVLAPKILGKTVGLGFWQSLGAVLVGVIFFGPLGATIAIPIAALVKYLLDSRHSKAPKV